MQKQYDNEIIEIVIKTPTSNEPISPSQIMEEVVLVI